MFVKLKSDDKKTFSRLLAYVRPHWLIFLIGIISVALSSCVDAAYTWMLKPILDKGFIARDLVFIKWAPLLIILGFAFRGITSFIADYCIAWIGRTVVMALRQDFFNHVLHLPASFYDERSSGQIISTLVYNIEQVSKACTDALVTLVRENFLIVGLLGVMFVNSWQLTLLFMITVPVLAVIASYSSKRLRRISHQVQNAMGSVTHVAEEAIEGYRVVRLFGGENYEIAKFKQVTETNQQHEMKAIATNALTSPIVQMIAGMVIAVTIYLATLNSLQISAGAFTSMVAAMLAMLKPMRNLTNVNSTLQRGLAGAQSIFEILDLPAEQSQGNLSLTRAKGEIIFQDVSFSYPEGKLVLKDINLQIKPGQTIAIVGRSGSGKTTLVSLLQRLYDNYQGRITLDGTEIREVALGNLRSQLALVSQQVTLFNDTIGRNIAYGCFDTVTPQHILNAAQAAHAMDFIEELPQGINTEIGENGLRLSGGQRQRLAIARAILKDAPILILDEATSALDTEAERHIQAAIETLKQSRTTLVIAHRLSTVENADLLLVMDAGQIVEIGKHSELLKHNGIYAKLYNMQFKDS
jgi:subfamily B ATP-binding cassette protein MsbA